MSNSITEKNSQIKHAEKLWDEVVSHHKIDYVKKQFSVNDFKTGFCYLTSKNNTVRGIGKGAQHADIEISASYEALEQYFSSHNLNPFPVVFAGQVDIAKKYPIIPVRCDISKFKSKQNLSSALPWVIYQDIKSAKEYAVPLAAVDLQYRSHLLEKDEFDYANCAFYAASNGLASGTCYDEAVLHGVLEVIERDAFSYFLIDTFILNKSPRIIAKNSLPTEIITLIKNVEHNYANKIVIIEIPSRFDIPVYQALFLHQDFELKARGTGAALNRKSAIERAIFELIQIYNLSQENYIENKIDKKQLDNNELIRKILNFEIQKLVKISNAEFSFHDNAHEVEHLNHKAQLSWVIDRIYANNEVLLTKVVYADKNGLTCTSSIIPGAEEFFLATHYFKLAPKTKTAEYIYSQTGTHFSW